VSRFQGAVRRFLAMYQGHAPVQVSAFAAAQRSQISQLCQQAGDGGQGGFSKILQSGFQRHLVTNSEQTNNPA